MEHRGGARRWSSELACGDMSELKANKVPSVACKIEFDVSLLQNENGFKA